jgi:hypothetical protein
MSDYVYDPAAMEKIFAELADEDGEYGYSVRWNTKRVKNETTSKWEEVEDEKHDTFEYDGVSFWWYHAKNKDAKHPVIVASWSVRTAIDDSKDYEEEIDASAEDVAAMISRIDRCGGRLEWED